MTENIDHLAQVIRQVDGDHTLGAGALAEALTDAGCRMLNLPEPTMDMADPHLALWESGVSVYREVVYVPHFLPLEDLELVEQAGMDLLAAAAYVLRQKEKEETNE